jgi:hypothetical protein
MRFGYNFCPLFDEASGDTGNGGGGAAATFTKEQQAAITASVAAATAPFAASLASITEALAALKPAPVTEPVVDKKADDADIPPAVRAQLAEFARQQKKSDDAVAKLTDEKKKADERAERTERESSVLNSLGTKEFVNDKAKAGFVKEMFGLVTRATDGTLAIDNLPVADYIAAQLEGPYDYVLKPRATSGTGMPTGGQRGKKIPTLDMIKPGMSAEDTQEVLAQMRAVMPRR